MRRRRAPTLAWLGALAFLPACAELISADDLRRVDCVGLCEGATGGQAGAGGVATGVTTGDASSDARGGASGRGGSAGSGTSEAGPDGGDAPAGADGSGGSSTADGAAGAGGAGGTAGSAGVGGSGGSGGGAGSVCPAGGGPPGWVCVSRGTFNMGSPPSELGRDTDEQLHQVTLTRAFWIQATEVSQSEWQASTGSNPSTHKGCGSNCPVEVVSWFGAAAYANALSTRDGYARCYEKSNGSAYDMAAANANLVPIWRLGLDCPGYRLPTEAEWEYAARAGSTTAYFSGNASTTACMPLDANLDVAGWYCANAGDTTHATKGKRANAWGIYDMHGNAWEWVWDWAGPYPLGPATDPTGPASGTERQSRGGSYFSGSQYCRSAYRSPGAPDTLYSDTGFRLVRSL